MAALRSVQVVCASRVGGNFSTEKRSIEPQARLRVEEMGFRPDGWIGCPGGAEPKFDSAEGEKYEDWDSNPGPIG